jgi:putative FmdB family regulatory protein
MPTYDYICNECGERFENFQTMSSRPLTKRPDCEEKHCNVNRVISGGSGLIFKGSGFYLTDYKDQSKDDNKDNKEKKKKKKNDKQVKKDKAATTAKTEK